MSKLIAVLCINDDDFLKHVSKKSNLIGVINWKALTTDNETFVPVYNGKGVRGLRFSGYEMTECFCDDELLALVKTRVVK